VAPRVQSESSGAYGELFDGLDRLADNLAAGGCLDQFQLKAKRMQHLLEIAHLRVGDAVEVVARENEIIIRRQRPRVTMTELLARFDPTKHRHDLHLDVEPIGTETPPEAR